MQDSLSACASKELFALQVLGDAMQPEFPDKCIILIEPGDQAWSGMYILARLEGTLWFRQYIKDEQGERLVAANKDYPDIPLADLNWTVEGIIMQRNIRREVKHYKYEL